MSKAMDSELRDALHNDVQSVLTRLDALVREDFPGLQVVDGKTSGQAFELFSYRTYSINGDESDPFVAGVTVRTVNDCFQVTGDISSESNGDVYYEATYLLATGSSDVLAAAKRVAEELVAASGHIRDALLHPSRPG